MNAHNYNYVESVGILEDSKKYAEKEHYDLRYAIDASKLRNELDWQPQYTNFKEGLKATIDWYTDHRDWWEAQKAAVEAKYAKNGQ